jgi:hypothetical protein
MHQKLTVADLAYPDWPLHTLGISVTAGSPEGSGQVTDQTSGKLVSGGGCGRATAEPVTDPGPKRGRRVEAAAGATGSGPAPGRAPPATRRGGPRGSRAPP